LKKLGDNKKEVFERFLEFMSNTKFITAIVAFVATFIFSAGLVRIIFPAPVVQYVYVTRPQYVEGDTNAIENFIRQDNFNGDVSNRIGQKSGFELNPSNLYFGEYADSVADYVKISANMNVSQFPTNFQNAWREHQNAWRNYAEFLADMKTSPGRKNISLAEFNGADKRYGVEISQTYKEVIRIGRSYGADIE
jgi:hypothetical protein